MRQVYTSLRVETVEGVARLLEEAGIEVHIANGRSYHSKRGSQFSYSEPMRLKQQPSVWVRKAEDQPRARELLRQAGLMASSRAGQEGHTLFAPEDAPDPQAKRRSWAWRIRVALIVCIAIASLFTLLTHRSAPRAVPDATPAAEEEIRVQIPAQPEASPQD